MAKITPSALVAGISGRTCQLDNTHFKTNAITGKIYAVKLCNPADQSNPTERQKAVRNAFASAAAIAKAWRLANAPTESNPKGTAEFQAMYRQYKAQHKVGNWLSFVRTKIKDGKVPSFIEAETETTPQQPSTGTGSDRDGDMS